MKRIALIAHDAMKPEMVEFCKTHKDLLGRNFLCGTGVTAEQINAATGLPVKAYLGGPMGGDMQIGAEVAEGKIDMIFFFSDPLTAQPHDPDIKALIRIAQVYDVPIANNRSTAEYIITSELFES